MVDFLVVDMKITKELSQAPIILGQPFLAIAKAITDLDKREVMTFNEEEDIEEPEAKLLPSDDPTLELKPLTSSLKYVILDVQYAKPLIMSS